MNKWSFTLNPIKNKLIANFVVIVTLFFSVSVQAQQTVLLDVNGNPISDEVLLLISQGEEKLNQKPISKLRSKKDEKAEADKVKTRSRLRISQLEEELFTAMQVGNIQRVKQLLRAGVRPTYKNNKGETPIGIAVIRGWASMVIELVENGADIHEKGIRGVTLLHVASSKGLIDVAKVLVKEGLNPSVITEKKWTSLHVAARFGHWQLVQYFVSIGVDPNIRNTDGKTALELARHLRHQGIIKILTRVTTVRSIDFVGVKSKRKKRKKR